MNHANLIARAWRILWRHKMLWLFGIVLALTGSGGGSGGGGGSNYTSGKSWDQFPRVPGFENFNPSSLIGFALLCCCLLMLWAIAATILRYVARTALYRSVDQIEETGTAPTWREGVRLGWDRRAFRIWLLDLIIGIPFVIAALLLLALGAAPLLLLLINSPLARGLGIALTVGLELAVLTILIVAGVVLTVLNEFWSREIAIGGHDLGQAFTSGYRMVRGRLRDAGIIWLLLLAISVGFGLLLIPVVLVVLALAAGIGAGLGFALYRLTGSLAWAIGVGLPPFLLITIIPLTFIQGLYESFKANVWTLAYREIAGRAAVG